MNHFSSRVRGFFEKKYKLINIKYQINSTCIVCDFFFCYIKKRIIEAYRITQRAKDVKVTDIKKIEAMIYAMADKFLDSAELAELKEEIKMTRLGQMLREDGLAEGLAEGLAKGIRALIVTCQELGASKDITSEKLMQEFQLSKEEADKNIEQYWKK